MVLLLNTCHFCLRAIIWLLPLASFGGVWLAQFHGFGRTHGAPDATPHLWLLAVTTMAWLLVSSVYKVDSVSELFRERTGTRAALAAVASTYAFDLLALFLAGMAIERAFFLLSGAALFALTVGVRAGFRYLGLKRLGGRPRLRVLIAGTDEFARESARRLREAPFGGCRVAAYLHIPGQAVVVDDARVLELKDVPSLDASQIDDVVIALGPALLHRAPEIAQLLDSLCRPMRAIVDFGDQLASQRVFQFGGLQMMNLQSTPAESPGYAIFKRLFDIAFSSVVILLTFPLMLAIAAAIKLGSPGPVLFRQSRVGLNGRTFGMLKFRTMRVSSEAESDTLWTIEGDPRRTAVGTFLRRSSLDELPQFFNVLRGEMSVVGPRPERPHFVHRFQQDIAEYHQRHRMKVGITGWAQVNGLRGDTSIRKRVEYDLHYLRHWSLGFDLRIIARTVWCGFFGTNAY